MSNLGCALCIAGILAQATNVLNRKGAPYNTKKVLVTAKQYCFNTKYPQCSLVKGHIISAIAKKANFNKTQNISQPIVEYKGKTK